MQIDLGRLAFGYRWANRWHSRLLRIEIDVGEEILVRQLFEGAHAFVQQIVQTPPVRLSGLVGVRLDAIFQTFVRISNGGVLLGRRGLLDVGVHVTKERGHVGVDVTGVDGIFTEDAQFVFGRARAG